jgi:Yip1 domain
VNAEAPTAAEPSRERQWWLRTLAVFQSPRPVFAALRDESKADMEAREEPVLALIVLAGIAGILLVPETGRLLNDPAADNSGAVLAVLVFLTGGIYGIATYWLGGALLYVGLRGAGSSGSYRRARHVFAFAAAPTVLGLVLVWPVRLALYGTDSFRSGGEDHGTLPLVFDLVSAGFALWALGLLVYGISVVEQWRLLRAGVSVALAVLAVLVLTFPFVIPLSSR